jgi:serine/threonine protein kinase
MIGKIISHYRILQELGRGGMGVVYKAHDTKLDRDVALKFLSPELTRDPEAKQRFVHEAKAASALDHPNICTIHEIGETEDHQLFIVMSCYQGHTLKESIGSSQLAVDKVIDIAIQIAEGLQEAHTKSIIHRDIKPANIMITEKYQVKIMDFGLAKLKGQTVLTKESSTLGTVAYMSPEQARGETVDHRTDIWSLGAVLYEMISGRSPFQGEYEQAVVYGILNEQPEPLTAVRTGIPMELEKIVEKCLSKDPSERYQHMDELLVDLRRVKKEPELKSRLSEKENGGIIRRKIRNKYVRLVAGMSLVGVIAVAGYFIQNRIFYQQQDQEIKSIAILPFDDLSPNKDQEYFCDGMTEQLTTNLSRLEKLRVRGRNSVMQFKNSAKTIPQIARELKVDYVLEGSIRKATNRVRITVQLIKAQDDYHLWANDYDRQLDDIFNVQDDIAKAVTGVLLTKLSAVEKEKIKTERPISTEAYEYLTKGKYYHSNKFIISGNMEDFLIAEKMLLKAIELDSNYAAAYVELTDLYNTYYFSIAKTAEEKSKFMKLQEQFLQKAFRLDSSSAEINRVKGSIYMAKDQFEKAYYYTKRSVELDSNNEYNNQQFGNFLSERGLYNISIKYFLRVLEIDPLEHLTYDLIRGSYWNTGQLDKAEIYSKKELEIYPLDNYSLFIYARILFDMKKYDQFEEIRSKLEKMGTDSADLKYLRSLHYILNGEKEKALKTYVKPDWSVSADFLIMRLYDHFGMNDEFIQYLQEDFERLKKREESWYLWLKNAALFDNLRSDPHFQEILEKHKQLYEANLKKYGDLP